MTSTRMGPTVISTVVHELHRVLLDRDVGAAGPEMTRAVLGRDTELEHD